MKTNEKAKRLPAADRRKEIKMKARNSERVTASAQVIQAVQEAIRNGEYKVGDKLPNEQTLCEQLAVGRSSVREGMRILSAYGIVEIRQGDGTYVTDDYTERAFEFLGFLPENRNLRYLLEMREMIEVGCAKLLCRGDREEAYAQLIRIASEIDPKKDLENNVDADKRFHLKIVELTENLMAVKIYKMLSKLQNLLMIQLMSHADVRDDAIAAHERICNAIRSGDELETEKAIRYHIDKIDCYRKDYIDI